MVKITKKWKILVLRGLNMVYFFVRAEKGKQKVRKHLTMFLKEAYALYLDSCVTDDERCSFTTFSNL